MQDENFEWRAAKAAENLRDHGIAFDKAVKAFADPFAVEWIDEREAYGEERCNLLGMCEGVILHVTYLEAWGKPVAFYSDKHGVFRVNHEGAIGGDGMTQFGRALHALNIDIICANSSQAKGRVERANKTLQDRLVKELRLAGACSLAEGNALLPAFMADYNVRFGKPPANAKDLHRPLGAGDDLEDAFAWKEERTLSQALTLQYDKVIFILEPSEQAKAAIGKRITVVDYPDGRLSIRYKGVALAYRTFDELRHVPQAAIVENKRLGAVLAFIREQQIERAEVRSRKAPRRRDQRDARLFKVG